MKMVSLDAAAWMASLIEQSESQIPSLVSSILVTQISAGQGLSAGVAVGVSLGAAPRWVARSEFLWVTALHQLSLSGQLWLSQPRWVHSGASGLGPLGPP